MKGTLLPLLLGLLSVRASHQEQAIPQTDISTSPTSPVDLLPRPTAFNHEKRADHIPPNFCGWFSGSGYDQRWTYNNPAVTCFWNSDVKFVGNDQPPRTACVPQDALSTWSCSGAGCSSSVAQCTGSQPYCVTFSYGADYLSFVCSEKEGVEFKMEPFWAGFSEPIAFPVYTGSNGVSTGTQYPPGYTTTGVTTANSDSDSKSTSSSQGNAASSTSGSDSTNHSDNSTPVGAIVGGVIGGLALIGLFTGAIVYFAVIRPRKQREAQPGPQDPPNYTSPSNQPVKPGFSPQNVVSQYPSPQSYPQNPAMQQVAGYEYGTQSNRPDLASPGELSVNQPATAQQVSTYELGAQQYTPELGSYGTHPAPSYELDAQRNKH